MTVSNGIERRIERRRADMIETCKDCPIEGFKVVKKIMYLVLVIVLGSGTFNTVMIKGTNEALAKNDLIDAVQHKVATIQRQSNKENIDKIVEGFETQKIAFNTLEKSIIKYYNNEN